MVSDLSEVVGSGRDCWLRRQEHWAAGIPRELLARAIEHSLCFGLYDPDGAEVGLARVVTDYATFAYLCDVYILEDHRGKALGKWLMECVTGHPALQGLRRFSLATRDAHGLYRRFGFEIKESMRRPRPAK